MKIAYSVERLDNAEAWRHLGRVLGDGHPEVVRNTIRHLRLLGAKSYVTEDPYIDRDYSADYQQFYARTFRVYSRHCKRVHFFSVDVSPLLSCPLSTECLRHFRKEANNAYCGFSVIRPLPTAPVGRTVLLGRVRSRTDLEAAVTCRAEFNANLIGIDLQVTGTSFLQQDARVGACAQVAIWAGMRHMHARYSQSWVSVADITRSATPITSNEAVSIPPGSEFLTSERMIRAISEAGYQPLCFSGAKIGSAILPYVESGIPVILGLQLEGTVGHAVTVIGRVFAKQDLPTDNAVEYIPAYVIHDDQRGPYLWLPMTREASDAHALAEDTVKFDTRNGTKEMNVAQHATFAVALMPTRVFSTAAAAEVSARDRIEYTLKNIPRIREKLDAHRLPVNDRLLNELHSAHNDKRIILRTYLTSAAGYRRHIADGTACDDLKDILLRLHLPHFTWITEISTIGSYNNASGAMRRIYGHTILDATSTGKGGDGLLMLHLPGIVFTSNVNAQPNERPEELTIIMGDKLYECREKRL